MRRDDLAGNAEAEIGLVAGAHHADEFAAAFSFAKATRCTCTGRSLFGRGGRVGVAAGEQQQSREGGEGEGTVTRRRHVTLL